MTIMLNHRPDRCIVLLAAYAAMAAAGGEASAQKKSVAQAVEEKLTVQTDALHTGEAPPDPAFAEEKENFEPINALGDEYKIGAGDLLTFRFYQDPSLDGPVTVRYDGFVSLPFIEDIQIKDMTRKEAVAALAAAYEAEGYREPEVDLTISEVRSKSYYVMGAVASPREFPFTRATTLLDAINNAGGMRINTRGGDSFVGTQGQLVKAMIIRETVEGRKVRAFDLRNLDRSGPHEGQAPIFPGDIVYVPEGVNLIYILGQIAGPGVFELRDGMTLMQAIVQAGGPIWRTGRVREVVLMREVDENNTDVMRVNLRKILDGAPDPVLQAGDVIYIPQKHLTRLSDFVSQFNASISPVLNLYGQVWDAFYTDNRYQQTFGSGNVDTSNPLALADILQTISAVNSFLPGK